MHASGGPKPKASFKPMDVRARRQDAVLEIQVAAEQLHSIRRRYNGMAEDKEVLAAWRTKLMQKFEGGQDRARAAVKEAEDVFTGWVNTSEALGEVTAKLGLAGPGRTRPPSLTSHHAQSYSDAWAGFEALRYLLGLNDPVTTGRWATLSEKELTADPPVWQREILSSNHYGSPDRIKLRNIELLERRRGEVISSFEIPADMTPNEARNEQLHG
ncbi:hypothetical protein ADK60_38120 [Streptomyces sp. XY431]|uniref:hypothetical protein n=1 Tax=Streptomyces sp. XY431 TaxID=1415562 RepID=UPI0006AEC5B9|nr:hypothetical protein [Streptomyces sp. XY431]KOV10355.1 hypothetical protein ADK60_38120 [Streptomyces sp. XY431]